MKCRICNNEKDNQIYEVQELMFGYRDVFQYFQCSVCNCLQIKDISLVTSKYYPDNYYSYDPTFSKNIIKKLLLKMRNDYAFLGVGFIGKLLYKKKPNAPLKSLSRLSLNKDAKILDVGCGAGNVLYYLNGLGFNNLLGIDPFIAKDIDYGNGLKIIKQEIQAVGGQWDLVMFHHSFEHVTYPLETMQSASRLLTPNGTIVIRLPTVSSYAWKHYKVSWVQLDAPRHFYLHSIESMKILADHSGLNLHEVIYDSSGFQFWGSEQYVKGIPFRDKRSYAVNPRGSIFSKEEISAFNIRAHELNEVKQGDQAIFLLRKS